MSAPKTNERVLNWYNDNAHVEDARLESGRLEKAVTMHYIQTQIRELQETNGRTQLRIADIGCGTGVYALPLAKAGHEVSISDISSAEISLALQKASQQGTGFTTAVALDACELREHAEMYKESYYDLQLWLGPLYHILEEERRRDALLAACEMTKPGGCVAVAFVTRNAHLRDVAINDPGRLHREAEFYAPAGYLADGLYTRGSGPSMHHTTVPEIRKLLAELTAQAAERDMVIEVEKTVSCEGFLGFRHAESLAKLNDAAFEKWLGVILQTAEDETTLGCADHILVCLRRMS